MKTKIYITSTFHSLIKGKLKITKDCYQEGYFIIDTACTNNIVNNKFCNEESLNKKDTGNIIAAGNISMKTKLYQFTYAVEDVEFQDNFQETGNIDSMIGNTSSIRILGILGLTFLWKHRMVIDYNLREVYTLPQNHIINLEEYHFKFPLAYGLEKWQLPIIGLSKSKNTNVALAMIDTGSNVNIMCKSILDDFNFKNERTNDICEVINACGKEENMVSKIHFCILSVKDEEFEYQEKIEYFNISDLESLLKEGKYSIGCILGNQYMIANQMIIDFNHYYIYSNK